MALVVPSSAAPISDSKSLTDPTWYRWFTDLMRLVHGKYDTANISSGWQTALAQTPIGTYTPTITDVTNVDLSAGFSTTAYIRVGTMVVMFGRVDVDCTAAASTASEIGISLPIASNFTVLSEAGGAGITAQSVSAAIGADATNNRLRMRWLSESTSTVTFSFIAGYQII